MMLYLYLLETILYLLDGEIARPAIYELKEGEGLKDLIRIGWWCFKYFLFR